jgi:hypothetical protein
MQSFSLTVPVLDSNGNLITSREAKGIRRNAVKSLFKNNEFSVKYIRERSLEDQLSGYRGKPVGVVISQVVNGKLYVGWSLANKKDKYERDFGILVAVNRLTPVDRLVGDISVPYNVRRHAMFMVARSLAYFKDRWSLTIS